MVEDKRADGETNRKKGAAWEKVHKSFTEIYGEVDRTPKQIRQQWKNMKLSARRNFSLFQEGVEAWGSGEPPPRAPSELDTEVHLLIKETKQFNDDDDGNEDPPLQGESTETESQSW